MGEDARWAVVLTAVALVCDVADTSELAEMEYGFVEADSRFVLLVLPLVHCG